MTSATCAQIITLVYFLLLASSVRFITLQLRDLSSMIGMVLLSIPIAGVAMLALQSQDDDFHLNLTNDVRLLMNAR